MIYIADAYYRLSKEDGDKAESDSILNQKALIKEFLREHPNIHLYKERVDDGFSGVNFERPSFQKMLSDIQSGKINCVIVKDLSRFGRNYIETGRYIEKIFPLLGVRFIAINDNIDTVYHRGSYEEIWIPFKNLMNDAYCKDISIKVRSHLDMKRKTGQYIGSFAPYGYKKSTENKNKLIIDERAACIVYQIFQWKIEGMSSFRIVDKLNELGIPTPMEYKRENDKNFQCSFHTKLNPKWIANEINRILQNEVYTGVLLQGKTFSISYKLKKRIRKEEKEWIRYENSHEPIISKEDFKLVKFLLDTDTRVAPKEQTLYLFSGLTKCGYCRGNMTKKTIPIHGKTYNYLICIENKNKNGCQNKKQISLEKFKKVILKIINLHVKRLFELNQMLELRPKSNYFLEELKNIIIEKEEEIEKKYHYIDEVYEDYKEKVITKEEYLELKNFFEFRVVTLKEEVQALKEEIKKQPKEKEDRIKKANQIVEYQGFKELTRELLLRLVKEIRIYDKNRVEIDFKFQSELK